MAKNSALNIKGRIQRAVYSIIFFIASWYVFFTLEVNKLAGLYRLILIIPLFFAFTSLLEAVLCYCVLKNKKGKKSVRIYQIAVMLSVASSIMLMFI